MIEHPQRRHEVVCDGGSVDEPDTLLERHQRRAVNSPDILCKNFVRLVDQLVKLLRREEHGTVWIVTDRFECSTLYVVAGHVIKPI